MGTCITRNRKRIFLGFGLAGIVGVASIGVLAASAGSKASSAVLAVSPRPKISFEQNVGQWDGAAKFLAKASNLNIWATETGIVYDLYRQQVNTVPRSPRLKAKQRPVSVQRTGHVVKLEFAGGRPGVTSSWGEEISAVNYIGNKGAALEAATFEESRIRGVYPGVDVRLYVQNSKARYDLIVHPGANPGGIKLRFDGAAAVLVRSQRDLDVQTTAGTLRMTDLFAYQQIGATQRPVPVAFRQNGDGTVGFNVGSYDQTRPLVIDPMVYSSLLGGTGSTDVGFGVKADALGHAYAVGYATAETFPTTIGAYDEVHAAIEGFITKFLPDGSNVVYSTYIGGDGVEACYALDIDADGNVYVTGETNSDNLPSTPGAAQGTLTPPGDPILLTPSDFTDAFVLKLNSSGASVAWATYLGGERLDFGVGIAVGSDRTVYVTGNTQSETSFPTVGPIQGAIKGDGDLFITKVAADGTAFVYSTYLGGTDGILIDPGSGSPYTWTNTHADDDQAVGIRVDSLGFAFVVGETRWNDIIKVPGSYDTSVNGWDALVYKVNQAGSAFVYGTFIGGNNAESAGGIAIDSTGNAYITGNTSSFNFPLTPGVFDSTFNLGTDSFITKINQLGNTLSYSTFMGVIAGVTPLAIAVDDLGFAHVTGSVAQTTLTATWIPITANADDPTYNGPTALGGDAFLQVMNDKGTGLLYCSYLGGSADDAGLGVALDGARNSFVTGYTFSHANLAIPFPTTTGVFKDFLTQELIQTPDAFVSKIKTRIPYAIGTITINPNQVIAGDPATGTVTLTGPGSNQSVLVTLANDNAAVVTMPGSITIPPGATSGTFNIATTPNVQQRHIVRITATVEGDSKTATLTIDPWLDALTLSNDTVVGGNPVGARVTLNAPARGGGAQVPLTSTNPSVASVPSSVTVLPGETTVIFDVITTGVATEQFADITALYAGLASTKTLRIIPANLLFLAFDPQRVAGGTSSTGTIQLDGFAPPGGAMVSIVSDNFAAAVPATVTVPEQTSSTTFTVTTSIVTVNTTANITATYNSRTVASTLDVLRADLVLLTLNPDSVLGGNPSTGIVAVDAVAGGGGLTVALSSSDPLVASVPSSVQIAPGSTSAQFTVTTFPVPVDTNVTISATRGSITLNANLEVRELRLTLTLDPTQVTGGSTSNGTVELDDPAPAGGTVVDLSSDLPAVAQVPTSVTINEGETDATFVVTTSPVTANTTATITATSGIAMDTATLDVLTPTPVNLVINPSTVPGGSPSTGTVTLNGPAPAGGVVVALSSSNPAAASVPGSVTVNQGTTNRSFTITTFAVAGQTVVTITATVGATSVNATITVTSAKLTGLFFLPARVRGGTFTQMTVILDAAAPPGGASVSLITSNPNIAAIPGTVVVPQGATSQTVSVATFRVSRPLATQVRATYAGVNLFTILTVTR